MPDPTKTEWRIVIKSANSETTFTQSEDRQQIIESFATAIARYRVSEYETVHLQRREVTAWIDTNA
jgi:hypothetical protein